MLAPSPMDEPTVLIADDDPPIRDLWKAILSSHLSVSMVEAADGAEAVRMAHALRPDVIIMDLAMPVLDGLAATRALKASSSTARIPVIAITGAVFDSQRAFDVGCDAYLLKPIAPDTLVRYVQKALKRSRGEM